MTPVRRMKCLLRTQIDRVTGLPAAYNASGASHEHECISVIALQPFYLPRNHHLNHQLLASLTAEA
jgi:hypothetical protein